MTYHGNAQHGELRCHYCGRVMVPPRRCPVCGSPHIRYFGVGTQRVVDAVEQLLPQARVCRLDSDTMQERGGGQAVYQQMLAHEADILVGTQMVAKGLDFPEVTLAAVIAADSTLYLPDWRAAERTFQLVSQLIGRAGRRNQRGRAIVQTYHPEAFAITAASVQDYCGFYQAEIAERQLHQYPPFTHLIRLLFTSQDLDALRLTLAAARHYLQQSLLYYGAPQTELSAAVEAPYGKVKDRYRWQILLKSADLPRLRQVVQQAWQALQQKERLPGDLLLHIDVDPLSMM